MPVATSLHYPGLLASPLSITVCCFYGETLMWVISAGKQCGKSIYINGVIFFQAIKKCMGARFIICSRKIDYQLLFIRHMECTGIVIRGNAFQLIFQTGRDLQAINKFMYYLFIDNRVTPGKFLKRLVRLRIIFSS